MMHLDFDSKKIVFVEVDYHADSTQGFGRLFLEHNSHITFLVTADIRSNVILPTPPKHTWIVTNKKEIKREIKKGTMTSAIKKALDECDYVFLNTIDNDPNFHLCFIPYLHKTVIRIHNTNTTFAPFKYLHAPKSFFAFRKELSALMRKYILGNYYPSMKALIRHCKYIMPSSTKMFDYINLTFPKAGEKMVLPFPLDIPNFQRRNAKPLSTFRLVVSGAMSNRKKDFTSIAAILKELNSRPDDNRIQTECVFLGNSMKEDGVKIKKKIHTLALPADIQPIFFNTFVAQESFDEYLYSSDIILSPMMVEVCFQITKEYFGKTKLTGNVYDSIRSGVILLGPKDVYANFPFSEFFLLYDNDISETFPYFNKEEITKRNKAYREFLLTYYQPYLSYS